MRVLVADDSPDIRDMLAVALQQKGYSVTLAIDGTDALEKIAEAGKDCKFDVLLLDYAMPRLDGLSCAMKIRESDEKTKIGFFTAHPDMELPPQILAKLHARSWSKLNLAQMIDDLDNWAVVE